jgi:hypothetical protein
MSIEDLIQEIQAEAVDGKSDLSTVLRKCLVLGSQLGHQQLKDWANWELDGYPESSELPDYRVLHGLESFGIFLGGAGSGLQNAPLSLLNLPKQVRDDYANPPLRQGVKAIAEMLKAEKEGTIQWAWPAPACEVFDHKNYRPDLHLMQAWISVPAAALAGVLETIRNRVLNFVLEIVILERRPDDAVLSKESKETQTAQITQTFHQTIFGPVSNVGTTASISQTMVVAPGDLEGLKARLREKGLPEPELQELEKAIKADEAEPKPTEQHLGKNVANWLGDTVKKAGSGALKLGTDLVATVATKALKDYYGIG